MEVTTEAIVLGREDLGEYDSRVFLYTKDIGRVSAKAVSARKITSKLSAHVEPGRMIVARLVPKRDYHEGNFLLVDALSAGGNLGVHLHTTRLSATLALFRLAQAMMPLGVSDHEVWEFLSGATYVRNDVPNTQIPEFLELLGFDARHAHCEICNQARPEYFFAKDSFFVCGNCRVRARESHAHFVKVY